MKGPLTEHPVSLYGAVDVGEGQHWRLLWFNVTTSPLNMPICPAPPLTRTLRFIPMLRCPPPAPLCQPFDRGRTVQETQSGPPSASSRLYA